MPGAIPVKIVSGTYSSPKGVANMASPVIPAHRAIVKAGTGMISTDDQPSVEEFEVLHLRETQQRNFNKGPTEGVLLAVKGRRPLVSENT